MTIYPGFRPGQMLKTDNIEDAEFTELKQMTRAEKEGNCIMLEDAQSAALVVIQRISDDTGLNFAAEENKIKSAFFQMRDRINTAPETKE